MPATRILWGAIFVVFSIVLATTWGATQWTAYRLAFQSELGPAWFRLGSLPIYPPPAFFWWWYRFDAYAPQLFIEGAGIAASSGFASIVAAIAMSVARAREATNVVTYGSARWATLDEVRAAGLLGHDGVVLGRLEHEYLRHDPPPKDDGKAILDYLQAKAPPVYDPFSGGGSIPLEAQRLGLRAYGSDLNPVAVLIGKALVEIPPKFAGLPPVNPQSQAKLKHGGEWNGKGAQGLAEDVRYYGQWMRDEAEKRIGHLYPKAKQPDGSEATVIAWLWARTVRSPDPAAKGAMVPLVSSFMLSTKEGKKAWVERVIDANAPDGWRFEVKTGTLSKADEERLKLGTKGGKASRGNRGSKL